MADRTSRFKAIRLLTEVEQTISDLYKRYSELFPEHRDFWADLSHEETNHALIVRELGASVADERALYDPDKIPLQEIEDTLAGIKSVLAEAGEGGVSMKEALTIAKNIEHALIEKSFYDVFKPRQKNMQEFIDGIRDATMEHRTRVEEKVRSLDNK